MAKPCMMFYHDGRHPLIYMYEPPMRKEEYEAGVDELVGTPIEAIMFCLGDGRTVLHDTKVGELWGHNVEKWPPHPFQRAHRNAKALIEQGHDPLRIICDRAKEKGLLVYPTLLVQQGSGERDTDVRGSDFRFDNKHLEIGAAGDVDPDSAQFSCLDFKHEEVRDERFAIIEETLSRYDVAGFELQLNYTPHYFHPNEMDAGRRVMTDWVRRVYDAVKASGSDRELAIRIPASVKGCLSVGLDPAEWIRQSIVDVIIAQAFTAPELVDPCTDYRPLVAAAKGSDTRIHACIHSHLDSDRLNEAPIEMIRAIACNYWAQGIDGLYLAHWFNNWPYEASFYEKLRELPHPEVMASKDKFYHIPTATFRYPSPTLEPGMVMRLPAKLQVEKGVSVEMPISDDLPRWDEAGRVHQVLLRFRIDGTTELDRFRFRLNGKELPRDSLRKINRMYLMSAPRYRVTGYWFVYDLGRDSWPIKGANEIEITLLERDPDVVGDMTLLDVELETKYLMGRHFHRGYVDPALGPYEHRHQT